MKQNKGSNKRMPGQGGSETYEKTPKRNTSVSIPNAPMARTRSIVYSPELTDVSDDESVYEARQPRRGMFFLQGMSDTRRSLLSSFNEDADDERPDIFNNDPMETPDKNTAKRAQTMSPRKKL